MQHHGPRGRDWAAQRLDGQGGQGEDVAAAKAGGANPAQEEEEDKLVAGRNNVQGTSLNVNTLNLI